MTPTDRMSECNTDIQNCTPAPQWIKDYFNALNAYVGGTNPNKPHPHDYLPQ